MDWVYLNKNVMEAARERVSWIFREFRNVIVSVSGGKDSTVVYHLALEEAERLGRLPLKVMFIDEEAEWQSTIDIIRVMLEDSRVEPIWLQIPMRIHNALSARTKWLNCWAPGEEWMRERESYSIHENVYGTDRIKPMFAAVLRSMFPNEPAVYLAGVRAAESPTRWFGLLKGNVYKGETWGCVNDRTRNHYTFYPIYDWQLADVWKAIQENGWPYNTVYDSFFQRGVPHTEMRVSNLNHETAVKTLFVLQEIEPDTWNRLTRRLGGINMAGHLNSEGFAPKELPAMFSSWREYRDYLLEMLVEDNDVRVQMMEQFTRMERYYANTPELSDELTRTEIKAILTGDNFNIKLSNFALTRITDRGGRRDGK